MWWGRKLEAGEPGWHSKACNANPFRFTALMFASTAPFWGLLCGLGLLLSVIVFGLWLFLPLQGWVSLDFSSLAASIYPSVVQTHEESILEAILLLLISYTLYKDVFLYVSHSPNALVCPSHPLFLPSFILFSSLVLWCCRTNPGFVQPRQQPSYWELWFLTFAPFHYFLNVLF